MTRTFRAFAAAGLLAAAAVVTVVAAGPAQADTQICEKYGSTSIANGRYIVQNNVWGASTAQCINVTSTGYSITTANHNNATNGAPASYPSIYLGCHYDNCTSGSNLPIQVSQISSATSSISYQYTSGGTYNAAYDIWLDPTPRTTGQNGTEIMIWFHRQGSIQPIGSRVGTTTIGGRSWEVWSGNIGWNVVSYIASSSITSWNFSVLDFINDVRNRGAITNSWYLTSIQAGFEPWIGGAGLAVNSFSASVNGGGNPSPTASPTPTNPPPGGACRVAYVPNVWNNGYTAEVTITNTGSATINGWTLTYNLPSGQQITGTWNAQISQSGSAVTARNLSWNGTINPGGTASFGYQGTHGGSYSSPTSFTLNGQSCTRA